MGVVYNTAGIVTDGLVLALDAANPKSYPGSGTIWTDVSGNGKNGTLVNGVGFNSSNKGSLVFDGVDDHVTISQRETSPAFTYETFLLTTNVTKDQMYAGTTADAFYVRIVSSRAFLSVSASGQRTLSHGQVLQSNTIYHIVSIYNGVQLKIYVNGVLTEGSVINATMTDWGADRIGRWRDNDQRSFVGNIYTLRAYSRELTPKEIQQNFNALRGRYGI
jgi:hypothetical protein